MRNKISQKRYLNLTTDMGVFKKKSAYIIKYSSGANRMTCKKPRQTKTDL